MASTTPFLDALKSRRSIYAISDESPISDARIKELVEFAILHSPSSYNVQSGRAVILFGENHSKFWNDLVPKHMKQALPEDKWAGFAPRINGFAAGHGTVLFFEDQDALASLGEKNPMVKPMLQEWSAHSQGMHQYIVWTALENEGLGASLQHFNFHPGIVAEMKSTLGLPDSWTPHAQLVFGKPTGGPMDKTFEPLENRVKVFA